MRRIILACLLVLVPVSCYADAYGNLKVRTEELDGSPSVYPTRKQIFDNGSLTDNGGGNVRVTSATDVTDATYLRLDMTNDGDITADMDMGAHDFAATTITGTTLTDGTLSITGGEILDATTLEATTTLGIEIGDVQQLVLTDGKLNPTTDNDIDLGDATHEFKDAFFDGTVNIDSLVADTADINGGTVDSITSLTVANSVDIGDFTITANGLTIDGTFTDGILSISNGSITSAVNGTFSGTVQAEQLTTTDDLDVADDINITGTGKVIYDGA